LLTRSRFLGDKPDTAHQCGPGDVQVTRQVSLRQTAYAHQFLQAWIDPPTLLPVAI